MKAGKGNGRDGEGSVSVFLWYGEAITPGAIAAAIGLCLRLNGISEWIMWEGEKGKKVCVVLCGQVHL